MRRRNLMLLAGVLLLTAWPLFWVAQPDDAAAQAEHFGGADAQAQQAIAQLAPHYQPWFSPVLEPASNEIASLLFALQAALGAGVIGFWLGQSVACERAERQVQSQAQKQTHPLDQDSAQARAAAAVDAANPGH